MANVQLEESLQLLQSGNEDAISAIYAEMNRPVFAVAFAILKDEGLAQDVVQDTFIKVRSSIDSYTPDTNPSAWIITIARNFALMEYRKRRREVSFDPSNSDYAFGSYSITFHESNPVLDAAMNALDQEEREIVLLHVISDYKHREIADSLNKPLGTVLWIYNKAIKKLKTYLEEHGGGK